MTIGTSLFLLAVGAILKFAVTAYVAGVDAVRRADAEDPHRKVYERAPAVARACATGS
jgi:hypothetical protein